MADAGHNGQVGRQGDGPDDAAVEAGNPFDRKIADSFRINLLSTGNETDRAEAYRKFRGRDPDVTALLKRRGFPTN